MRRHTFASVFAAVLMVPILPLVAGGCVAPAAAGETYARPASGVFTLTGHAWGHGHGMSQWGAQGAASLGISASTIVSTYYPGTQPKVLVNTPIRVKLSGTDRTLTVLPAPGLRVTDNAGHTLGLTAPATRWRVLTDGTGQRVQRLVSGAWSTVNDSRIAKLTTPVRFTDTANMISVVYPALYSRDYRGSVASWALGGAVVTNTVTMGVDTPPTHLATSASTSR
jgi:stage II sporulation protein D